MIDMPGVLLELSRVARESGIEFDSITPRPCSIATGYSSFRSRSSSTAACGSRTSSSGCAASSACTRGGWTHGPASRRRHDQLQRERALVPAHQGEPAGSCVRLRRRDLVGHGCRRARDGSAGRSGASADTRRHAAPGGHDSALAEHASRRRRRERSRGGDSLMAKKFDAKAKAKRQKIIAAVLCLVLLGALALPASASVLSSMNKKPPAAWAVAPPPPAVVPPAGAPPTGAPVSAAVPSTGALTN